MSDTPRFADNASRLAGLAGALLGWRPGEFWDATPAELTCVLSVLAGDHDTPTEPVDINALLQRFPDDLSD